MQKLLVAASGANAGSPPKRHGRPKADYDLKLVEKLAGFMATNDDIAGAFEVSTKTVERWRKDPRFMKAYNRGVAKGNVSLRAMQMQKAMAGDSVMLIWLGKNRLGQSDKSTSEHTGKDGGPLQIETFDAILKDARIGED